MTKAQILVGIQFVLFAALLAVFVLFPTQITIFGLVVGFVLMGAAVVVLMLSVQAHQSTNATMPNVSPTPKSDTELVERGIYSRVRHPIYSSVLLGTLGASLAHGHVAGLGVWVVIVVFFTYKSLYEETLLQTQYPQYGQYMTRTGRFIPPLRRE